MLNFIQLSEKHITDWNEFVSNHKNGNFFQTSDYFNLFEKETKNKAFAYGLFEDEKIIGIVVGVIESNLFPPFNKLTNRVIIRGGPLVLNDDSEIMRHIVSCLSNELRRGCIYIQIRNLYDRNNFKQLFEELKFSYIPHLDILIDLQQDEQSIIKNISSGKRGNVSKSINKGTLFRELTKIDEIVKGIDLIHITYKRAKLPVPNSSFFINAFNLLGEKKLLRVFGAYVENILIGVRFELCFKSIIYDWYAGSDLNYKNRYPNDFLPYHILLWGHKNGFKLFDFGGAGKPDVTYGVREHKIKFGGQLVEFGRFERINNPTLMNLGRLGLHLYKIIR